MDNELTPEEKEQRKQDRKDVACSILIAAAERVDNWLRREHFDPDVSNYDCNHSCCTAINDGTVDENMTALESERLAEVFAECYRPQGLGVLDLWWPAVGSSSTPIIEKIEVQTARILALLLLAEMIETDDIKI